MITWTTNKLMHDVQVHEQNVTVADLNHAELPTDIHIVEYENQGKVYSDAVRAYKMCDIFDVYHDKLRETGGKVINITSGYGRLRPNLYKTQKAEAKDNK